MIWEDEPLDPRERAHAIEALHEVHARGDGPPLEGILYWKLSTRPEHAPIEPFMLHIGESSRDALQEALLRFSPAPSPLRSQ